MTCLEQEQAQSEHYRRRRFNLGIMPAHMVVSVFEKGSVGGPV